MLSESRLRSQWLNYAVRNIAKSVRVNRDAHLLLEELCSKTKQSKAEVIELALRELGERMFWQEVQDAFANPESVEMRALGSHCVRRIWKEAQVTRGQIYLCDLEPRRGRKLWTKRPVLIFSSNAYNASASPLSRDRAAA